MSINIKHMMNCIQKSGVKIPNAVIVSGVIGETDRDEQVLDFLKGYGKIERFFVVDDSLSEFYQNLIIEYSSGSAIEGLESHLPYRFIAKGDPHLFV